MLMVKKKIHFTKQQNKNMHRVQTHEVGLNTLRISLCSLEVAKD